MTKKILVYWRDIPSQVIIKRGRQTDKVLLSNRFQEAIDRAAMRAGKGSSEAYIAEWRREYSDCDKQDDLKQIARHEAEQIENSFSDEDLLQLIKNHGQKED